ncbi:MAG: GntR family transcriptional regulator [Porticoccaceae bacterium]|jgi:DNA-binding GntR family transcriptional regulator|nr:GntR family transcriptional regulator [Porticoccaceae bacterium]MEA3301462.1 GntR family transcriptional regulator [Pseudomonadota bacterium]
MGRDASVTDRAYQALRHDLLACRLVPGQRINISRIQRDAGFSQAAVREALSRLTAEGLVEIERNAGFRAAAISTSGFRDLAEASQVIEIPCLRLAIAHGDLDWEGRVLAIYHVSSKSLPDLMKDGVDLDLYTSQRETFYEVLLAPCPNPWLLKAWKQLYIQQMRYRHHFRQLAAYEAGLTDHYRRFIDAVLARDADRAEALCRAQYDNVVGFMESLGDG